MQNTQKEPVGADSAALDGSAEKKACGFGTDVQPAGHDAVLYDRYVRALALLCECAPFVDEADYLDLIDDVLADACNHYPLVTRRSGIQREIAPRLFASDDRGA